MPDQLSTTRRSIPIARPVTGEEEWLALREPLMNGWLTQGPRVTEFERNFAARHGVEHAIATTSCTTALHLSLAALGIGPGDEVIVPAFTWVATANVVQYVGATPVFVDIDPVTFNVNVEAIERALTLQTKAIIPVHLFGLCADINAIREIAGDIVIIEDAACAAGASLNGRPAGSLGTLGCFSFHPRKSITTGEGGMITTNDTDLAETINRLRNHGASVPEEVRHHGPKPYILPEFDVVGFNYRMTDLQAAVGCVQLDKLDDFISERQHWATYYSSELADIPWLHCPTVPDGYLHGWQSFVCRVDEQLAGRSRNSIMESLQAAGISTRPGTHAVHLLTHYRDRFGFSPADFPIARDCDKTTMAIPLHNCMDADDYHYVVETLQTLI